MPSLMEQRTTVNILVCGARGLRPATEKHKFAVTCDIGSHRHRTDVVEDLFGNPTFNKLFQDTIDIISEDQSLVMLVTGKKEKNVLGQVTIPLGQLVDRETDENGDDVTGQSKARRVALEPHRNCLSPTGELVFDAWTTTTFVMVSDNRCEGESSIESSKLSGNFRRLRERINRLSRDSSPSPADENSENNSVTMRPRVLSLPSSVTPPNRRHSMYESLMKLKLDRSSKRRSLQPNTKIDTNFIPVDNLSLHLADESPDFDEELNEDAAYSSILRRNNRVIRLPVSGEDSNSGYQKRWSIEDSSGNDYNRPPTIVSISPSYGPAVGGTKIVISGHDLGTGRDDVVALAVCGCDVLESLEYVSSERLVCTTSSWRACVGPVVVETDSGGRRNGMTSPAMQFTFYDDATTTSELDQLTPQNSPLSTLTESVLSDRKEPANDETGHPTPKPLKNENNGEHVTLHQPEVASADDSNEEVFHPARKYQSTSLFSSFRKLGQRKDQADDVFDDGQLSTNVNSRKRRKSEEFKMSACDIIEIQNERQKLKPSPPVGEIQPIRKLYGMCKNAINGKPPQKPPRSNPKLQENAHLDRESFSDEKIILITDLEEQLSQNHNEITLLTDQNRSLKEQYHTLSVYVEKLLKRIIDSCPEILSIDSR